MSDDISVDRVVVYFTRSSDHPYASQVEHRELEFGEFIRRHGRRFFWAHYGDWIKRHLDDFPT